MIEQKPGEIKTIFRAEFDISTGSSWRKVPNKSCMCKDVIKADHYEMNEAEKKKNDWGKKEFSTYTRKMAITESPDIYT